LAIALIVLVGTVAVGITLETKLQAEQIAINILLKLNQKDLKIFFI